jgi:anti-sigma B factor antagonist
VTELLRDLQRVRSRVDQPRRARVAQVMERRSGGESRGFDGRPHRVAPVAGVLRPTPREPPGAPLRPRNPLRLTPWGQKPLPRARPRAGVGLLDLATSRGGTLHIAGRFRLVEHPSFSTKVVEDTGATTIYVQGEIDVAVCERLRDAIEPHMGPRQTIVLDLSGVGFMDSSCIGVLVQARGTLTANGGSLVLRNPSEAAHRVLSITGIELVLTDDAEDQPPAS